MEKTLNINWLSRVEQIAAALRERAEAADREGRFVAESYPLLAEAGLLAAAVPRELGGGGASHGEVCDFVRALAHYCSSTALALSMHQHLVAATVWRHLHGKPGEKLLRRVAEEQLVLVSTGAGDWLRSNGRAERVDGGYRISGVKRFASGSPVGDVLVTSVACQKLDGTATVLHFPVPMNAPGVQVGDDWDSLGMRGTGSNTITLEDVFVPDSAIALERPREGWHPVWTVVLTVAAPLICASYLGVAERAAQLAVAMLRARHREQPASDLVALQVGELEARLMQARIAQQTMIDNANNYDFAPDLERANTALQAKTLLSRAVRETVDKAMDLVGGASYFRVTGLERLWRDARASEFHPLPEKQQQVITGRLALGLDPVD